MPLYQEPDAKLTLTLAAPAPRLVAEVARLSHRHLEVSPAMGTEILMVSVEDARTPDVLVKIATVATATWQPVEGGYRLVPDKTARSVEASAEKSRRLDAIRQALKERADEATRVAATKGSPAGGAPPMTMGFGDENNVDAFVPLLDLRAIAAMDSGDRIVFATSPNSAQRPLGGDPGAIVQSWIAKHNATAKSMSGAMDGVPDEVSALMKGPMGEQMRRMSRPVTAAPTKIVVVASRGATPLFGGGGVDVRLEVRAYGSDGSILVQETGTLGSGLMAFVAAMRAPKTATVPDAKSTPIAYTQDAQALIGMSGAGRIAAASSNPFGRGLKLPPTLRARLFSPEKSDPLALLPGEGLVALSKARRKPLVACLPDAAFPGGLMDGVPKTLEEVEQSLKTGAMRQVPDSAYLLIKPADPDTARRKGLDRVALAGYMRAIKDHEVPTLDELADFAANAPSPGENVITSYFLTTFSPNTMGGMSGAISWDGLRVYASLAPAQRQTLASGGRVAFQSLTPLGQTALSTMLYGASEELRIDRPGVPMDDDVFSRGMRMVMGSGGLDAREEPTELAPGGLPASGYLQASVEADTIVRPLTADGPSMTTLSTDELATVRLLATGPLAAQIGDSMRLPEQGRVGSRTVWNLRGYVAPGAYVTATLTDDRTPQDGATVSLSNLPADLQAKVTEKADKLKKSPLGAIIAMGAMMGKPGAKP